MSKEKKKNKGRKFDLLVSRRLINLGSTIGLVLALVIIYFVLASLLKTINLPTFDMTGARLYTLNKETKEVLKKLDKDVDIYILNFSSVDNEVEIIKAFEKENPKIHVSLIPDTTKSPTIIEKFKLDTTSKTPAVAIECGSEYQVVFGIDMYLQYQKSNKNVNLVEERIINSIISVTEENRKKICIYGNNSNHEISSENLTFCNDLITYGSNIELLSGDDIPEDCDLLVMPGLSIDLSSDQADKILNYIKSGKNILVLQSNDMNKTKYPNLQRILAEYNLKIGEGMVFDEGIENNLYGNPDYLIEKTMPSSITNGEDKGIYVFTINTAPIEILESDETVKHEILSETSDKAFIRTEYQIDINSNTINTRTSADGEYKKEIISVLASKNYGDKESKLIIFGSDEIAVDVAVQFNGTQQYLSYMFQNKLFLINSVKYLLENDKVIDVKKIDVKPEYTGSESEFEALRVAILAGSASIIVVGIIVWYVRRKRI